MTSETLSDVKPNTPLRLEEAAKRAFPDGSMTASGLRGEAKRSGLVIFRWATKDYTTLQDIENWIELCRRQKASGSGSVQREASASLSGSSGTEADRRAQAALDAILARPRKPSNDTSKRIINRRKPADVISPKFG